MLFRSDDDAEEAEKEHTKIAKVVISDEQVDQLEGLLAEYPDLRKGILKTYSLEGFETLPANMFQSVVKKINVSIEAKRKTA